MEAVVRRLLKQILEQQRDIIKGLDRLVKLDEELLAKQRPMKEKTEKVRGGTRIGKRAKEYHGKLKGLCDKYKVSSKKKYVFYYKGKKPMVCLKLSSGRLTIPKSGKRITIRKAMSLFED